MKAMTCVLFLLCVASVSAGRKRKNRSTRKSSNRRRPSGPTMPWTTTPPCAQRYAHAIADIKAGIHTSTPHCYNDGTFATFQPAGYPWYGRCVDRLTGADVPCPLPPAPLIPAPKPLPAGPLCAHERAVALDAIQRGLQDGVVPVCRDDGTFEMTQYRGYPSFEEYCADRYTGVEVPCPTLPAGPLCAHKRAVVLDAIKRGLQYGVVPVCRDDGTFEMTQHYGHPLFKEFCADRYTGVEVACSTLPPAPTAAAPSTSTVPVA